LLESFHDKIDKIINANASKLVIYYTRLSISVAVII